MVRRTRLLALLTLAMINVFTLAAGIAVARMLPPRLAALKVPIVAAGSKDAFKWSETAISVALTAGAWVVADSYRGMAWLKVAREHDRLPV